MRGGRILSILRRDGREEKEKAFWHGWDFLNTELTHGKLLTKSCCLMRNTAF